MANLSLLGLWLHWTASVEHRQYCRLIIWKYLVAALVPVSEEVCRSVDVYQRGKLLTLELKTGTLLKLGVRFKVTLVVVNLLWNIGNVIWVEAYHYFQVILLIIGGNFIHNLVQNYQWVILSIFGVILLIFGAILLIFGAKIWIGANLLICGAILLIFGARFELVPTY